MPPVGRLAGIQVLRGIAAMLVTVGHFCLTAVEFGPGGLPAPVREFGLFGVVGVDLFFCISGFVMLVALPPGAAGRAGFLVRRFIRIMPMYWLATTALVLLAVAAGAHRLGTWNALTQPTFAPGFILASYLLWPVHSPADGSLQPFLAQGWTLSYEIYFYLLLALTAWKLDRQAIRATVVAAALAVLWALARFESLSNAVGAFLANPIPAEFVMGMAAYLLAQRTSRLGLLALAGGTAVLLANFPWPQHRLVEWGLPSAIIVYGLAASEGSLRFPALLARIGDASYSLYLTHGLFTYLFGGMLKRGFFATPPEQIAVIAAGSAFAILFSLAVYRWIERPLIDSLNARYRRWMVSGMARDAKSSV